MIAKRTIAACSRARRGLRPSPGRIDARDAGARIDVDDGAAVEPGQIDHAAVGRRQGDVRQLHAVRCRARHRPVAPADRPAGCWDCACRVLQPFSSSVRHEFHQRAVGIAEIDAGARALGAVALHRPEFDAHALAPEMRDRVGDRPDPFEAEIAVAGRDRKPRDRRASRRGRAVELLVAEPIGEARRPHHQFGAENVV